MKAEKNIYIEGKKEISCINCHSLHFRVKIESIGKKTYMTEDFIVVILAPFIYNLKKKKKEDIKPSICLVISPYILFLAKFIALWISQ